MARGATRGHYRTIALSLGTAALAIAVVASAAGAANAKTKRVSVRSSGAQAVGGGSFSPSISRDGRFVAFYASATDLVPFDTNSEDDIFRRGPLR